MAHVIVKTNGSPRAIRLGGWVFLVIGGCLLGLGVHLAQQERARVAHSVRATGVVESLAHHTYQSPTRAGSSSSYAPTVRFRAADGRTYVFTSSEAATRPASYAAGEQVAVYYDPARPANAQLHGFLAQWMKPVMVLGMGAVFALMGWLCLTLLSKAADNQGSAPSY